MNGKPSVEQRIKEAFPELEPSAGHDYVDEIIGLLRIARMQRDDAETRYLEAKNAYTNMRDFAISKGLETATQSPNS